MSENAINVESYEVFFDEIKNFDNVIEPVTKPGCSDRCSDICELNCRYQGGDLAGHTLINWLAGILG